MMEKVERHVDGYEILRKIDSEICAECIKQGGRSVCGSCRVDDVIRLIEDVICTVGLTA